MMRKYICTSVWESNVFVLWKYFARFDFLSHYYLVHAKRPQLRSLSRVQLLPVNWFMFQDCRVGIVLQTRQVITVHLSSERIQNWLSSTNHYPKPDFSLGKHCTTTNEIILRIDSTTIFCSSKITDTLDRAPGTLLEWLGDDPLEDTRTLKSTTGPPAAKESL